ncbi:hypothetical protein AALA24_03195 [Anaerovoracaceae bacterium 42-11]
MGNIRTRVESKLEVESYIQSLKYALKNNAAISFQQDRQVDQGRDIRYTNRFTVADLFPDENPIDALKRELQTLTPEEYIQTVKDIRFPKKSEMREFGRVYRGTDDVYIKIRVELLADSGKHTTFIMSFHYAAVPFTEDTFPYKRKEAQ